MRRWTVSLTRNAKKQLATIKDQRVQEGLKTSLRRLEYEPDTVLVVALGIRKQGDKKDVYELAKKLLRSDLLDLE